MSTPRIVKPQSMQQLNIESEIGSRMFSATADTGTNYTRDERVIGHCADGGLLEARYTK